MTTDTIISPATFAPDTPDSPDLGALKARQQAIWSAGNYAIVGTTLQIVGETLCEAVDLQSGETVLDVAAGNGNASLAAARRWAEVTSTDYVPALLQAGRARAEADELTVTFQTADAEALPFDDASFDVVLSTFGVMFTADHARAAAELARVCRPGGRIGLANWTPDGFIGQLFKVIGGHVPPPPGARSPALWGTRAHLDTLFAGQGEVAATERTFTFRYRSPAHFVEVFRTWYWPVLKALAALSDDGKAALEREILALAGRMNRADDGTLVIDSAYLEVVILRS